MCLCRYSPQIHFGGDATTYMITNTNKEEGEGKMSPSLSSPPPPPLPPLLFLLPPPPPLLLLPPPPPPPSLTRSPPPLLATRRKTWRGRRRSAFLFPGELLLAVRVGKHSD